MTDTIGYEHVDEVLGRPDELGDVLSTVLDAAITALHANGGIVLAADATGELSLVAERGLRERGVAVPDVVRRGEGVLGAVLTHPRLRRGRVGDVGLEPGSWEPVAGQLLVAPLHGGGEVVALLALLRLDESGDDSMDQTGPPARAFDDDDEKAFIALVVQAQTGIETVRRLREARMLAVTDELTGLWNARYLFLALTREAERASRFGHSFAVLMLDIDRFKDVNDEHGHARGDEVLREVAGRLSGEVRDVDVLARYGGEEFVVVAPETDAEGAIRLAARLVESVRERPFVGDGPALALTASVGVAVFPDDGSAAARLMVGADRAMYAAKAAGRDRWAMCSTDSPSVP